MVKLDKYNFEEAWGWFHPKIKTIMNVTYAKMVAILLEDNATVQVSKIIPLPTFLAPLFIKHQLWP